MQTGPAPSGVSDGLRPPLHAQHPPGSSPYPTEMPTAYSRAVSQGCPGPPPLGDEGPLPVGGGTGCELLPAAARERLGAGPTPPGSFPARTAVSQLLPRPRSHLRIWRRSSGAAGGASGWGHANHAGPGACPLPLTAVGLGEELTADQGTEVTVRMTEARDQGLELRMRIHLAMRPQ